MNRIESLMILVVKPAQVRFILDESFDEIMTR